METKKNSVYGIKLSGFQIDIIQSAIENAIQGDFFSEGDRHIAEVILEDIGHDAEELI